eukprot:9857289-Karenia_brevis.AAC.1
MLYAYLDDIYATCEPARTRAVFDLIQQALREEVGIDVHLGKCRCWNQAGAEPPCMRELGQDVWVGGNDTPRARRGVK